MSQIRRGPSDESVFFVESLGSGRGHQADICPVTSRGVDISQQGFHQHLPDTVPLAVGIDDDVFEKEDDAAVPDDAGDAYGLSVLADFSGEKAVFQGGGRILRTIGAKPHFLPQAAVSLRCQGVFHDCQHVSPSLCSICHSALGSRQSMGRKGCGYSIAWRFSWN